MQKQLICPCGSGKAYAQCCEIAHNNIYSVKTAEQLMRSRYTAFTIDNPEYLHKSHHSSSRPNSKREREQNAAWAKSVVWLHLDIINKYEGNENDKTGTVEFKAYFLENNKTNLIHENSSFAKENGHWVYIDGCYNF